MNSPDNTLLTYMLLVKGSMDSLLPNIDAVEAVGISAVNKLFFNPYLAMRFFN